MRARSIKPGFFTNEHLAALGPYPRLLFAGLWLLADRKGRLEDRPPRIKGVLFPYEPRTNVVLMLKRLTEAGFIQRYAASGTKYIQIVNFEKHQNPHIKEADSTIPAPCSTPTQHQTSTVQELLTPDSGLSDSPFSDSGHTPPTPSRVCVPDLNGQTSDRFEEFFQRYPHQIGKAAACQIWLSVVTSENVSEVFAGLERWKHSEQWARAIYAKPQNWLRDHAWNDHPAPARNQGVIDQADIIAELDRRERERHA